MRGAAYATGIGQIVTLAVYLLCLVVSPVPVKIGRKGLRMEKAVVGKLYGIGIPATLNMALPSLLISALNGILAGFSETYVLVLGVYYKLQTFIYLTANGIIQGIRPLVGYNYGAGEHERVEKYTGPRWGLPWVSCWRGRCCHGRFRSGSSACLTKWVQPWQREQNGMWCIPIPGMKTR